MMFFFGGVEMAMIDFYHLRISTHTKSTTSLVAHTFPAVSLIRFELDFHSLSCYWPLLGDLPVVFPATTARRTLVPSELHESEFHPGCSGTYVRFFSMAAKYYRGNALLRLVF